MLPIIRKDTIAAPATPPGRSAIAVIRVSGPEAIDIVNRFFQGKNLKKVSPFTVHFGKFTNAGGKWIDEVLVTIFRAPRSYTGEDVVEISCHGSMVIIDDIMKVLIDAGVKPAEPGEFTLRAFVNQKLDLSQAEAVADLIDSESRKARDLALNQLRGGFSRKIKELREKVMEIASLFELELDFGEEDVEFASNEQLLSILDEIESYSHNLMSSFIQGNALKRGVSVVIAGRPNAGKSTLLNAMLEEERAIISDIPGTTRDFIEDLMHYEGVLFRFADTAGITQSQDIIEMQGVKKTHEAIARADILIYLFDLTGLQPENVLTDLASLNTKAKIIVCGNKMDMADESLIIRFENEFKSKGYTFLPVSARHKMQIEDLKKQLIKALNLETFSGEQNIVINQRHYHIFQSVLKEIEQVKEGVKQNVSKDLTAISLRNIIQLMGEITGEITTDEILGNIFSRFCIGK